MVKAFEIADNGDETVEERFAGMHRAFHYGAPPHGGMARMGGPIREQSNQRTGPR